MFFSQDWRERIKQENPEASFGEVGRLLGAKWSSLSDSEKKPYQDMAERDKQRAESDKAAYVSFLFCFGLTPSPLSHSSRF